MRVLGSMGGIGPIFPISLILPILLIGIHDVLLRNLRKPANP